MLNTIMGAVKFHPHMDNNTNLPKVSDARVYIISILNSLIGFLSYMFKKKLV